MEDIKILSRVDELKMLYNAHLKTVMACKVNLELYKHTDENKIVSVEQSMVPDQNGRPSYQKISVKEDKARQRDRHDQHVAIIEAIETLLQEEGIEVSGEARVEKLELPTDNKKENG